MSRPTFINTDRLDLTPAEEDDLTFLRNGVNHPKIRKYISIFSTPHTEERYRDERWPIAHDSDGVWLLAVPNHGEFVAEPVGSVQLYPVNETHGWANFGIWFHPKAWGKGYALEASAYLFEYGFRSLRLHRISATTVALNDDAMTLCRRLGFVHEGTARETQFVDGRFVDVERFGLLSDEWTSPRRVLAGTSGEPSQ